MPHDQAQFIGIKAQSGALCLFRAARLCRFLDSLRPAAIESRHISAPALRKQPGAWPPKDKAPATGSGYMPDPSPARSRFVPSVSITEDKAMTAISHGAVGTTAELYESFNKVSRMLASKTGIGIDAAQEAAGEALLKIVAKHDERALSAAPGEWSGLLYRYGHFLALHALRREEECRLALGGELLSFATAGWEEAWDGGATPLVAPSPVATVAPTARRAESRADKYRPWSKGEVVAAFIQFRDDHGYPPRVCDLGAANGMPSRPTVLRLFGSTTAARSAAGLEAGRAVRRKWTKGEAEEALRRYVDEVGTWPNSVELNRDSRLPSNKACERLFGTGSVKKLRLMIETPEEGES